MGSVKNLLFWKKVTAVIGLFAIINSMIVSVPLAQAQTPPISSVTGQDQDTTFFGLDGNDFSVNWTTGPQPGGFTQNRVYIVPDATSLTATNVDINGCGGSACTALGFFDNWTFSVFMLPPFHPADSAGTTWNAATSYKACVVTTATANSITCSSAFSVTSDSIADDNAPFIDFYTVQTMVNNGSNDVIFYAAIDDEQTSVAAFGNTGDGGAEYFKLKYFSGGNWDSFLNAAQVNGNLFKFTVPFANIPAVSSTFRYYFVAADADANLDVVCANFSSSTESACQSTPFIANVISGATVVTVAGTVKDLNNNNVEGATVFPSIAAPSTAATTAANGTYTVVGVPASNSYDFAAYKSGYCETTRFEQVGASNKTGVDMYINNNACFNDTSQAQGGSDRPFVHETIPWEGQFNVAPDAVLALGLSSNMDATTINDTNPTDAGDKVYLTSDDGTTKVAGNVLFCTDSSAQGCSGYLTAVQSNMIIFDPTANLSAGPYTLVANQGVLSASGRNIDGSRTGGGHELHFSVGSGTFAAGDLSTNFGQSGAYMPPYVKNVVPQPGFTAPTNTKITVEFNDAINSSTVTASSVQFLDSNNTAVTVTRALSTDGKRLTITPAALLSAGEYKVVIKGSVANINGVTMRDGANVASNAFEGFLSIGSASDATAPTVFPFVAQSGTIAVNEPIRVGFSEAMDESTLNFISGGVALKRGGTNIPFSTMYDPGSFELTISPNDILPSNTAVTLSFVNPIVKDFAGNAIATSSIYSYTTGDIDSAAPATNGGSGCDDFKCRISFTEPMEHDSQTGGDYNSSVLKPGNFALVVDGDTVDLTAPTVTFAYSNNGVDINGLNLFAKIDTQFTMTVTGVKDLSGNGIATSSDQNIVRGKVASSSNTFGSFGGEASGMFGPPTAGGGTVGGAFKAGGGTQMGGFAMDTAFGGGGTNINPFNRMAGQDSNVMQINFSPGVVLQDGDQLAITFPTGTVVTAAVQDTWSPFKADFNMEWGSGTVTFDSTFDADGISANTSQRKVTVQLDVTGTPGANDRYTIDLKGITNPTIPKGPSTSGYTATVKGSRGNTELFSSTSMPYFIDEAGTNTLTVNVYAGSQGSPDNVAGTVNIFGWGPAGPMDKSLTLASGIISEVNGTAALNAQYTSLPNGCYNVGTEPFITLGATDYFGQEFAEPVCVNGGESKTHNIVLASASSTASATLTVKLAGISDFNNADIDIFAGGPGRFVVKSLTSLGAPDADGYTMRLPANGNWHVGVGPGMPKGSASVSRPKPLPGIPPSPMEVIVRNVDTTPAISRGIQQLGPGVSFDDSTDTITFTFAAADKSISGTVKDGGGNALSSVDIGVNSQFGGVFTQTAQDGTFTLNVSDYGTYEINAFKWGLPSVNASIEVRIDGADAGTAPDIYYKGKQITGANPLVIKMKKADYSISGRVLKGGGSALNWVPVKASDANGNTVFGGADDTGNYSLFVDSGVWTITAQPPMSETEECSTYSKTVTITNESKSSQNLEPVTTTCYTLTGTVTVAGTAAANVPLMIEEWDTVNSRPAAGGVFKPTSTNSSGVYTAKVTGNKTYRINTWDTTYGEISDTVAVTTSATTTKNLTSNSAASMTFGFTGLSADDLANLDGFVVLKNTATGEKKVENLDNLSDSSVIQGLGDAFTYDLQIPGVGVFTGTVSNGETESIDLSTVATDLVSYSGTVVDDSSVLLPNAVVTFENDATNVVKTVMADANGAYDVNLPTGNWIMSASLSNHMPLTRTALTLSADSANNPILLEETGATIEGTVYKSDGTTPADSGFVTATSSTGEKITATIESDGTYGIPVGNDTYTVTAGAALHSPTNLTGTVVISSDTADTGNNITMTANATKTVTSSVKTISAGTGGTVDDTQNTGVEFTTAGGVVNTNNTDVNITAELTYESPDTTGARTLGNAGWEMTAADTTESYSDFTGTAKLEIDYTDLISSIPSGASESDLLLVYWSEEHNDYVPVEGGFTIDTTNNTVTANTDHFTTFSLVVPASAATGASAFGGAVSYYPQSERAVVEGEEVAVESGEEGVTVEESVEDCVVEAVEGAPDEASAEAAAGECLPAESEDVADVEEEKSYVEVDEDANTVTYFVPPADTYEVSFSDIGKHWSNDIVSDLAGRGIIDGFKVGNQLQFKPNQGMTRAELIKAVVRAMELPVPLDVKGADLGYYDVRSDSEYAPYIYAAQKAGIVDRALLFRPNAVVNRAEALKIILLSAKVDLADFPDGMVLPFADVSRDSWFRNHVKYAFFHGIVGGYAKDGKREFRGVKDVSRAEASKMISEVFKFEEKDGGIGDMLKAALFGLFR